MWLPLYPYQEFGRFASNVRRWEDLCEPAPPQRGVNFATVKNLALAYNVGSKLYLGNNDA